VGVENTQPPVLNSQRNGASGDVAGASRVWAASSPGKSRRPTKRKFPNFTLASSPESTFLSSIVSRLLDRNHHQINLHRDFITHFKLCALRFERL
jgi:hypothetical protein